MSVNTMASQSSAQSAADAAHSLEAHQRYLVQRIAPQASYEDMLRFPSFFEIETVHACNAKCTMCSAFRDDRPKGVMAPALFEKIAVEIAEYIPHIQRVNLFRDGEPFLDPGLEDRVAILKELGVPCVAVTSNMSLSTPERAEKILRMGLDQIDISIDGFTANTFESIRRGLKYETVRQNTLEFIRVRNALRSPCKIRVRMVLQQANGAEWEDYSRYWKGQLSRSDTVMNHPIHNWGSQLENFEPVCPTAQTRVPCVALWSLMPIFSDGTVPLCNVDYSASQCLGDVTRQSIAEIWRSERMATLRALHLGGNKGDIALCRHCNAWDTPNYFKE